jgi:hypothetical protein
LLAHCRPQAWHDDEVAIDVAAHGCAVTVRRSTLG